MEGIKLVVVVLLLVAAVAVMKAKVVTARVYTVGGEDEWSSEANFETWANMYNFSVGDVLVFRYVKGEHNVYEVREEAYKRCEASGGNEVVGHYARGEDEIELREAKKYFFICNVAGHCLGGMRFTILVLNHNTTTITTPASASFTTIPPPSPSPSNSSPSSIPHSIPLFTTLILHLLLIFHPPFIVSFSSSFHYHCHSLTF